MPDFNIYLAPFQGITTYSYREVYTQYFKGVNKLFTPFYTGIQKTKGLNKRATELGFTSQNGVEVVPQILSKEADEIIRFVEYCEEKGFQEVNWNLGCPYPRVANKKRGSGILPYPDMVDEILDKVMPAVNIRFSIKCRLGYLNENEILNLVEVYNSHDIAELTIHARIGKQLYAGDVNIDAFSDALSVSKVPVVYNGDIFTSDDLKKYSFRFPQLKSWMIGRGLLVDPFLPAKICGQDIPDSAEQKEIAYLFMMNLYLAYRKKTNDRLQSISVMKELWSFLCYSFSSPGKVFSLVKKTKSFEEYENAVSLIFREYNWLGSEADLFRKGQAKAL